MEAHPTPFTRLVTTHEPAADAAAEPRDAYHALSGPAAWQEMSPGVHFSLVYSSEARPNLAAEQDVAAHEQRHNGGQLGLSYPGGSVCRVVELAPQAEEGEGREFMHRTTSLDYGIILSGEVELRLPNQAPRRMNPGDICVQRGTMHAWHNLSKTQPARIAFVLIAADMPPGPDGQPLGDAYPPMPPGVPGTTEDMLRARRT